MKLRSVLKPVQASVLRTGIGTYRLEVDDSRVDCAVFEKALREGRCSLSQGRTQEALEKLQTALRLWRGSAALADVRDIVELEAEGVRFDELRMQAEELTIEASLAEGRAVEVIPDLFRLTVVHPFRERFVYQLMLALAMSGRLAEALDVYVHARRRFIDQLGMEPPRELMLLHSEILRNEGNRGVLRRYGSGGLHPRQALVT
ncbi:BTAD domain-containing putative transcriptional regulator [Streptomyces xinghaiensis]|uniref:AfsR/SARP family transcriptional regulator n=1 Tax=Streptomyces xinghaiensis TaxID=1038928 RepID=UPI0037B5B371